MEGLRTAQLCDQAWRRLTMAGTVNWQTSGVKFVRAHSIQSAMPGPTGMGRATAFDFAGTGGRETWIGAVTLQPGSKTGAHHHGRHEVAVYVVKGRGQIRWGERLEFASEVNPGDFAYFPPYVPHQELNLSNDATLDFVVVRSDNERIAIDLDIVPAEQSGKS
jgi:uncharacterized RmlC-like cupin family protein